MNESLRIKIDEDDRHKKLRVEGRLDTTSAQILENSLMQLIKEGSHCLLVDFKKVDYLSSAGMRVILAATKKLKAVNGKIIFFNISEEVMEIIKMAGFELILNISSTEEDAVASI